MPYITIRLTDDGISDQIKKELISDVTNIICSKLNKNPLATTVIIEEVPCSNWGIAGMTAKEFRNSSLFWDQDKNK